MILELDVGNTRAKWRIVSPAGEIRSRGEGDINEWIRGCVPAEWMCSFGSARVSCVRGDQILEQLRVVLTTSCAAEVSIAQVSAVCGGVRNGYSIPDNLGVDRWLAIVAAFTESRAPLLIVDAGSALTIDLVDGDGLHRGGFIVPGFRLMHEMLLRSTDRIRIDGDGSDAVLAFGQGTTACVCNGALLALMGTLQAALTISAQMLGSVPAMYLTGGDADRLLCLPEFSEARYRPDLVMDGLRHVLP